MAKTLPEEVRKNLPVWKQEYGEVFFIPDLGGQGLMLRNFTLGEHEKYVLEAQIDQELADENLVNKCVIWPDSFNLDELAVPAVNIILTKLNEVSPYDNPQRFFDKLEQKRGEINTPKGQMYAYISAAFPGMKLPDIQNLYCDQVLTLLALAEKILGQTFQLTRQGELAAVPEQGMSPQQIDQHKKLQRYKEKKAAREKMLQEQRLSQFGGQPQPEQQTPEPQEGAEPLLKDRDEMMQALWHRE